MGGDFLEALPTTDADWIDDPVMRDFCERLAAALDLAPSITIDDVVNSYKGTKFKTYATAREQYYRSGVNWRDARLRSFVKFEKCDVTKAPRVINPRSAKYNLLLGKFLKHNEHKYFDAIATVFQQPITVIKGLNAIQSASAIETLWNRHAHPTGVGGDASKFDMHVSEQALKFEHLCYLRPLVANMPEALCLQAEGVRLFEAGVPFSEGWNDGLQLAWLLAGQLYNRGVAYFQDGSLEFEMAGTRASGDLNTSLGNCILMCAMTWAWSRHSHVDVSLANNGDDCMYIVDSSDVHAWQTGFEDFFACKGFRMVLEEPVNELEEVEFCQSQPVRTHEGLKMVRNPKTLLVKASMCLLPVDRFKVLQSWMMAVGTAEGSLCRGVPVLQAFARAMRRNGKRCSARMMSAAYYQSNRFYHADLEVRTDPIGSTARNSFHTAFGLTPAEQLILEDHFDRWVCAPLFGSTIRGLEAVDRDTVHYAPVMHLFD